MGEKPITKFSDQEVSNLVLRTLANGDKALAVVLDEALPVQIGDIEIGNVGLLDANDTLINPSTKEGVKAVEDALVQPSVVEFNEALSVPSLGTETLLSYTVPAGKNFFFRSAKVSGSNYAVYSLKIDGVLKEKCRTHSSLDDRFTFDTAAAKDGVMVAAGKLIEVLVFNFRPWPGDFECTLYGKLV